MSISSLNGVITLFGRVADIRQAVTPIYPDTSGKPAFNPSPILSPFERAKPEEVGVPSSLIADFIDAVTRSDKLNLHSLLILRNGKLITEAVWDDQSTKVWKSTFSASKSIVSLAIGFLYDEGKIRLTDKLTELFSDRIPPFTRLTVKDLTVRSLLTMSTGASFNEAESMTERDWVKGFFGGNFAPGSFAYNSLNTYLLSVIVKQKTGQGLTEYLRPRLFEPLQIKNVYWETCPLGIEKGGWGLYIYPEDMAKLGQLVLNDGAWNGKQLISQDWIYMATHRQIATGAVSELYDYGYQIWTGRRTNSFLFNGMFGQNVLGLRDSGILIVSNAGNDEMFQSGEYFRLTEEYFCRSFGSTLPADEEGEARLRETIDRIVEKPPVKEPEPEPEPAPQPEPPLPWWKRIFCRNTPEPAVAPALEPEPEPESPLPGECAVLSGAHYEADDEFALSLGFMPLIWQAFTNNYSTGFTSLSFRTEQDKFYMTYMEKGASHTMEIGFDYPADTTLSFNGVPYLVRVKGAFARNEDGEPVLKLRVTFAETPTRRYIKIFYGKNARIVQTEEPGGPFVLDQLLNIKDQLAGKPLGGAAKALVDDDYLRYRVERKFSPCTVLKKTNG